MLSVWLKISWAGLCWVINKWSKMHNGCRMILLNFKSSYMCHPSCRFNKTHNFDIFSSFSRIVIFFSRICNPLQSRKYNQTIGANEQDKRTKVRFQTHVHVWLPLTWPDCSIHCESKQSWAPADHWWHSKGAHSTQRVKRLFFVMFAHPGHQLILFCLFLICHEFLLRNMTQNQRQILCKSNDYTISIC